MKFEKLKSLFKSDPESDDLPTGYVLIGAAVLTGTMLMIGLTDNAPKDSGKAEITEEISDDHVSYQYLDNGTRLTFVDQGVTYGIATITLCDGLDMVDLTYDNGRVERSVGHAACADGKITQEDFRIPG